MRHGKYIAKVEYDEETGLFEGDVINTRDVITFSGSSVDELRREFGKSIEVLEAFCKKHGVEPSKPYSGRFVLRLSPETHQRAEAAATQAGTSLNAFIADVVERQLAEQE